MTDERPTLTPIPRLALSIPDAADAIAVSARTVEELIRMGELRCARIGRRIVVPVAELDRYLTRLVEAGEVRS